MDLSLEIEEPTLPFSLPNDVDFSCKWDDKLKVFFLTVPNGELIFSESFFTKKISDRSVEYFQENDSLDWKTTDWSQVSDQELKKIKFSNIKWKHDEIKLYGKYIPLPRLTSWYGDQGKVYTYSGIKSQHNAWNEGLLFLKKEVEKVAEETFNSVLLNWYRNGEDHLSWHADDEIELGENPTIASVNFGEERDFVIRRNEEPSQKITIPLSHGALLIMRGELQHFWQHAVPKRKKVFGSRFNLTFRHIYTDVA